MGSDITCTFKPGANWIDIGVRMYASIGTPLWGFETSQTTTIPAGIPCNDESGDINMMFCEIWTEKDWTYHEEPLCR